MMINNFQEVQQDSVTARSALPKDTLSIEQDSVSVINPIQLIDSVTDKPIAVPRKPVFISTDTTSVCSRSIIADITFYDTTNVIQELSPAFSGRFPFNFVEKNKKIHEEARTLMVQKLKPGLDIPLQPLHQDWIILIILLTAFLYALVRTSMNSFLPAVTKFFLFGGINDLSSRNMGGLFLWQSTILNLISFLILGLFGYYAAAFYDIIPLKSTGILFWFLSLIIIISAVTIRHFICLITGYVSGERDVFREYLLSVYLSYRFSALFLFTIIVTMSYTEVLPLKFYFIIGIIVVSTMYLIRILRLIIIFITRKISIFYLILYLCALEILPVLISIKYISGLV